MSGLLGAGTRENLLFVINLYLCFDIQKAKYTRGNHLSSQNTFRALIIALFFDRIQLRELENFPRENRKVIYKFIMLRKK